MNVNETFVGKVVEFKMINQNDILQEPISKQSMGSFTIVFHFLIKFHFKLEYLKSISEK